MAALNPTSRAGKVNGLQAPGMRWRRKLRAPVRHPVALLVAGTALYGAALLFPLMLHQVTGPIVAAAIGGTALLLVGLHFRWNRPVLAE